jgi:hypothetical protein
VSMLAGGNQSLASSPVAVRAGIACLGGDLDDVMCFICLKMRRVSKRALSTGNEWLQPTGAPEAYVERQASGHGENPPTLLGSDAFLSACPKVTQTELVGEGRGLNEAGRRLLGWLARDSVGKIPFDSCYGTVVKLRHR